jgi:hypothetical protein
MDVLSVDSLCDARGFVDSFGEPRSVRVARDPASRSESILLVRNGVETELETSGLQMSPL